MQKTMWSNKQFNFLLADDKRINILSGSVRSGKTWISLLKFSIFVQSCPDNYEFIMVGKTTTALKRNCLGLLQDLVGDDFTYSLSKKQGLLCGRTVWLEGANDDRAESKIRGMTLGGAYVDELTQIPEDFYKMLLSRLSLSGAKLYATTNPDYPTHYVKTDIIDNDKIDVRNWHFLLDDNIFLDEEYKENLKKEYAGTVFYDRLILGLWKRAEGAIYSLFADNPKRYLVDEIPRLIEINVGVDFGGTSSSHAFCVTGITPNYQKLIALMSERHNAAGTTPSDIDRLICDFVGRAIKEFGRCDYLYWDNESSVLGRGVKEALGRAYPQVSVMPCYKATIKDRIDLLVRLMGLDRFGYTKHCSSLKEALEQAVWNPKKDDERLDDGTSDIDSLDSLEYTVTRQINRFIQ